MKPLFLSMDDFSGKGKVGLWVYGFSDAQEEEMVRVSIVFSTTDYLKA